jgi:hypothetical protein
MVQDVLEVLESRNIQAQMPVEHLLGMHEVEP